MNGKRIVTKDNYEIFAVDYLDGKLTKAEEASFLGFLDAHPDLKEEFELFFAAKPLEKETTRFPQIEQLKKQEVNSVGTINEDTYEEYFVAYLENDLSDKECDKLLDFLRKNIHLRQEFELTQKLKLAPDAQTVFPNKSQLACKKYVVRYFYYGISSVAAVLLLLFLFRFGDKNNMPDQPDYREEIIAQPITRANAENMPALLNEMIAHVLEEDKGEPFVENSTEKNVARQTTSRQTIYPIATIEVRSPEPLPSQPPIATISRPLQPERILIKEIHPEDWEMLVKGEEIDSSKNEKNRLWNFITWGAKKYNQITGEQITIIKVENEENNSVAYFIE
ncbi:MAG: hypothetical protein LBH92_01770 [Bacteroidales bacterium]|jgi:hypothetical protein|nr:hypothetical protein [Bacteroidales bacterium]